MKKLLIFLSALAFGVAAPVSVSAGSIIAKAEVLDSSPIVETVYEPVESCRYEYRKHRRAQNNIGDKVVGGVLGGAAGSAFGKGSGRDAAAALGAVFGSELADSDGITEGEIIGGIAGAIVGNQVGKGSGKTAATAIGALTGAIVGDQLQNRGKTATAGKGKKVRVCNTVERAKKVITGYEVTFEFAGIRSSGVVPYRPGKFVDINVDIEILEDRTNYYESE